MSALPRQDTPPEETPVAALPTTPEVLAQIRKRYTFVSADQETEALAILARRPDIASVLVKALPHVDTIFGEGTDMLLLVIDYHTNEPLGLDARIVTPAPLPEAHEKRDAFYRAVWNEAALPVLGDLSFGLTSPRKS